jgi:glutathionylspermidine synthase
MQLSQFDPTFSEIYTPEYWLNFFEQKYDFKEFAKNHFEYIDAKTFIEFSKEEQEKNNEIVRQVNTIFRHAYDFYFENFAKNLPEFSGFQEFFRKEFPYDEYFIGRYDIMIDQSRTLRFLETNANTPGMICESHYPARALTPHGYMNQSENLIRYTRDWWADQKIKF